MANNYSQATVIPDIPASLVTEFEKILLNEYGFQYEPTGIEEPSIYFYVKDNISDYMYGFESDQITEYADKGDQLAKDLLVKISEANITMKAASHDCPMTDTDDIISHNYSWSNIFQHILNKPNCEIDEIILQGAFTCDKMRPGEFGGWVSRITKTSIQHRGTNFLLGQMREESIFLEAIDTVCDPSYELPIRNVAVEIIREYCGNYNN